MNLFKFKQIHSKYLIDVDHYFLMKLSIYSSPFKSIILIMRFPATKLQTCILVVLVICESAALPNIL